MFFFCVFFFFFCTHLFSVSHFPNPFLTAHFKKPLIGPLVDTVSLYIDLHKHHIVSLQMSFIALLWDNYVRSHVEGWGPLNMKHMHLSSGCHKCLLELINWWHGLGLCSRTFRRSVPAENRQIFFLILYESLCLFYDCQWLKGVNFIWEGVMVFFIHCLGELET